VARLGRAGVHAHPGVVAVAAGLPRPRLAAGAGDVPVAIAVRAHRRAVGVGGVHGAVAVLVQAPGAHLGRGPLVPDAGERPVHAGARPRGADALLPGAAGRATAGIAVVGLAVAVVVPVVARLRRTRVHAHPGVVAV